MNLLLDSHTLIWLLSDPAKIRPEALETMHQSSTALFFSAASVWELELKSSKGKLQLAEGWIQEVLKIGISELTITADACLKSTRLPWHHKDPFDRLLVAQALEQGLTFATRDGFAALYGVPVLKV